MGENFRNLENWGKGASSGLNGRLWEKKGGPQFFFDLKKSFRKKAHKFQVSGFLDEKN